MNDFRRQFKNIRLNDTLESTKNALLKEAISSITNNNNNKSYNEATISEGTSNLPFQ